MGNLKDKLPPPGQQFLYWGLVAAGVAADLVSKHYVFKWLIESGKMRYSVIDGFFRLVVRENDGAAFSIASGHRWPLVAVSVVALIVIVGIFYFGQRGKITFLTLGLFTAGIIGNLYDRLFNEGRVRDFIDVYYKDYHWPAFNVADSMLCVAVGLIIITSLTAGADQKQTHQQKEEHQDR